MVTNVMLKGRYNVGVNSKGVIYYENKPISVEKDVPIVRYRFGEYSGEDLEYILRMMKIFKNSAHVIEFELSEKTSEQYDKLSETLGGEAKVARFLRVVIDDTDAGCGEIYSDKMKLLDGLRDKYFDRYMLVDKTSFLDYITTKRLMRNAAKYLGVRDGDVGVCGCASSFGGDQCISAVKARELMSMYTANSDGESKVALPTANHEDMNQCGCIRHIIIEHDIEAREVESKSSKVKKSFMNEPETVVTKKKPTSKKNTMPGKFRF